MCQEDRAARAAQSFQPLSPEVQVSSLAPSPMLAPYDLTHCHFSTRDSSLKFLL